MPGPLSATAIGPILESAEKRFKEKLFISPDTDCIVYQGADRTAGYKSFWVTRTKQVLAHRLAYELFVGPITKGHVINHMCSNRSCCNPSHLEDVTQYENSAKGDSWPKDNKCRRGHEFSESNTLLQADGRRRCKMCKHLTYLARKGVN